MAGQIIYLARATGWTEQKIKSMPISKLTQLLHAAVVQDGGNTVWAHVDKAEEFNLKNKIQNLINEYAD